MLRNIKSQDGATIIEVVVTLFIMAIGLLGLASLQMNAMKYEKGSSDRAGATMAAYDISEKIRANSSNALVDYVYLTEYNNSYKAVHYASNNCSSANCTSTQISENDINNWLNSVQQKLTAGTGYISVVVGAARPSLDIAVMWNDPSLTVLDATCPVNAKAPIGVRCFVTRVSP
jgi:type IV pilus assembly protein PilV